MSVGGATILRGWRANMPTIRGLSLPAACRIVAALSIAAKKPEPEAPDYARFEDVLTRERTPTLNTVRKVTAEELDGRADDG